MWVVIFQFDVLCNLAIRGADKHADCGRDGKELIEVRYPDDRR